MANTRVRQAVNHAVNKTPILQGLFGGYGDLDAQMLGKAVLGYNADLRPYAYDMARARTLLAEGGVPNGFRATMSVVGPSSGPGGANIASAIQQDLGRVGIQVELETQDTAPWLAAFSGPQAQRKDISYATINWERNFEADPIYRFWSSDRTPETGRRWMDETFDRIYQTAKATPNDQQRARGYQEAARYINENAPVLYLWTLSNAVAINNRKIDWQPGLFADAYFDKLTLKQ
jgi:peptide/nickel transport system substrate-binding protein